MSSAAPLLDFFRRGEVNREVRLLAAQGVLAPRAHEQIGLLILLSDDRDQEIRDTAARTLDGIPVDALRSYLGRSDVAVGVREFFGDRGIFPAEMPAITADDPLIDVSPDLTADTGDSLEAEGSADTLLQKLQKMNITERLKLAMRGSREVRALLIRDPNKIVAAAVLSSPKVTESEVEGFAKMATVSEEVLRAIGMNRAWLKNYGVVVALTKNPKCPVGLSLNLLNRLNDRDLNGVSSDRNVPDPLRQAARRKVVLGSKG
ncbi:MAG TPA: hypothetical protein VM032_14500 [Vicinamibacterales bacterium]|nr:hypothetical protein [Vicinamibacterales bacterium]